MTENDPCKVESRTVYDVFYDFNGNGASRSFCGSAECVNPEDPTPKQRWRVDPAHGRHAEQYEDLSAAVNALIEHHREWMANQ